MLWKVPRIWEGADVWILGGGHSIIKQFDIPEEIAQSVFSGTSPLSVFSPYMKVLHDQHVIGINVAFMIGNWIDLVFFGDPAFYLKYKEQLSEFEGLKVTCYENEGAVKQDWLKVLPKDREHPKGISTRPDRVSWNNNSGSAAISIAAWTGAKRILLLGFDMKLSQDNRQHFHDVYNRGQIVKENQLRQRLGDFNRHLRCFDIIAKDAKSRGIKKIHVNPDSLITQFPKFTLKELLWDNS